VSFRPTPLIRKLDVATICTRTAYCEKVRDICEEKARKSIGKSVQTLLSLVPRPSSNYEIVCQKNIATMVFNFNSRLGRRSSARKERRYQSTKGLTSGSRDLIRIQRQYSPRRLRSSILPRLLREWTHISLSHWPVKYCSSCNFAQQFRTLVDL